MDIQKRVAASNTKNPFHPSSRLARTSFFSPIAPFLSCLSRSSLSPSVRPRESTYGCSFGNHIFFVSQFAAPLNALPPFRRGCISVAAARYKFWRWLRALDGVGGKVGQGEEEEEKDRSHGNRLPPPYPQNPI